MNNTTQLREEQKEKIRTTIKVKRMRNELNEIFDVDMISACIRKIESLLEGNYFSLRTSMAIEKSLGCLNEELLCHVGMRKNVLRYLASKSKNERYEEIEPIGEVYDMPKESRLISDRGIDKYIDFIEKYESHSSLTGV